MPRVLRALLLTASLALGLDVGCASGPAPTCPATPVPPVESSAAPPGEAPSALVATSAATVASSTPPAAPAAAPPPAPGDDPHPRFMAAYAAAVQAAAAGDFDRAATALLAVIPDLALHPGTSDEFWAHNAMMMIREAQGDPASALAENDQATLAAARGTWEPDDRADLAYLKDRWHRAYLSRMLAESRTGSARQALVHYAEAALADYRERAKKLGGYDDSVAILEAYFAALDGRRDAARAAAARVDPAKDEDLEDLYLVVVGLEAGGDHARADAVRAVMRRPGRASLSRTIMLRWLEHDPRWPQDRTFSPLHAAR